MWCGIIDHFTATCPRRLQAVEKGVVKPLAPPRGAPPPLKPTAVGRPYVMSRKASSNSDTIVIGTLFLNFKPFNVLFDSGATYSFIST